MHNRLISVAEHRFADPAAFVAFANEPTNLTRFGIIDTGPNALVSTWHVDNLVKAFFEAGNIRLPLDEWKKLYNRR